MSVGDLALVGCADPHAEVVRWTILGLQVVLILLVLLSLWGHHALAGAARDAANAANELREARDHLHLIYGTPAPNTYPEEYRVHPPGGGP